MAEKLEVTVNVTNQKLQFTDAMNPFSSVISTHARPQMNEHTYTPLELLLLSLANCSGSTVAILLKNMEKNIAGIKVNAKGIRWDQHPMTFKKIFLEFEVNSPDLTECDIQEAIQLSERTYCPVWAMLKESVEIFSEYRIVT